MVQNEHFYMNKQEPNKSCLLSLRHVILSQDESVTETTKYGMPCFCYRQKMFCYLWVDKKTDKPYILFVEGKHLNHKKLKAGSRKRMKILNIEPHRDLPIELLEELLSKALNLYKKGIVNLNK